MSDISAMAPPPDSPEGKRQHVEHPEERRAKGQTEPEDLLDHVDTDGADDEEG